MMLRKKKKIRLKFVKRWKMIVRPNMSNSNISI